MNLDASLMACALIYVTPVPSSDSPTGRDHRSLVLPPGVACGDPARARQRWLCRSRHDLSTPADVLGADLAGRGHPAADPDHARRHLGMELSPRLERMESEGADSWRRPRYGRRHFV